MFPPRHKLAAINEYFATFSPNSLIKLVDSSGFSESCGSSGSSGSSGSTGIQSAFTRLNPELHDWQETPSEQVLHEARQSKQIYYLIANIKQFLTCTKFPRRIGSWWTCRYTC